ncbi:MAG TPA: ATP-binding protein, partial [Roseimicrobium sp.]|nr:ATP-binding protein [Roseimicrobium sp.]
MEAKGNVDKIAAEHREKLELAAFRKIVMAINSQIGDLDRVVDVILTRACELISANHGSLVLIQPDKQLRIVSVVGSDWTPEKQACSLKVGDGITGRVASTGNPYFCNDTKADPYYFPLFENVSSELAVPVISQGDILGLINIDSEEKDAFTDHDLQLLQNFADHAAIAIENARQFASARLAREEWRQIFETHPDGMVVCDQQFRVQRVNSAFLNMFDLLAKETFHQPLGEVFAKTPAFQANGLWRERLRQRGSVEQRIRAPGGGRSFQLRGHSATLNQQSVYILTVRETTKQDELQEKVHQSEKLASLGQMVAGVAHELNNPLQSIVGFAELMAKNPESSKLYQHLALVHQESSRAAQIVKTLLLFSRSQPPSLSECHLGDLVRKTVADWREANPHTDMELEIELATGNSCINADEFQIQQVIHNLLTNAAQAIFSVHREFPAEVLVRVRAVERKAWISIIDNGPGILPHHLSRIFDPFFTTKPSGKGTGLGLSICYSIIKEHQGRIWCESQPGEGAIFNIELPVHTNDSVQPQLPITTTPQISARHMLLIDDEQSIGLLLSEILQNEGIQTDFVMDAREAQRLVLDRHYDLILCDLKMPIMNGKEFYAWLKAEHPGLANRIIFATGDVASEHADLTDGDRNVMILYKP